MTPPLIVEVDPALAVHLERLARVEPATSRTVLGAIDLLRKRSSARTLAKAGVRLIRVEAEDLPAVAYYRLVHAGGRVLVTRQPGDRLQVLHLL